MNLDNYKITAVIPNYGFREKEIIRALNSIISQKLTPIEIIIVDQNEKNNVETIIKNFDNQIKLKHIRTFGKYNGREGVSFARNIGIENATGDYIIFCDDDSWYPENYFYDIIIKIKKDNADFITTKSIENINHNRLMKNFSKKSLKLNKFNLHDNEIEFACMFKVSALRDINGYDENLGVNSAGRWGSGEGNDLLHRLLKKNYNGFYYHDLFAFHPWISMDINKPKEFEKMKSYSRGFGKSLGKNMFNPYGFFLAIKPIFKLPISIITFNSNDTIIRVNKICSNLEGFFSFEK